MSFPLHGYSNYVISNFFIYRTGKFPVCKTANPHEMRVFGQIMAEQQGFEPWQGLPPLTI